MVAPSATTSGLGEVYNYYAPYGGGGGHVGMQLPAPPGPPLTAPTPPHMPPPPAAMPPSSASHSAPSPAPSSVPIAHSGPGEARPVALNPKVQAIFDGPSTGESNSSGTELHADVGVESDALPRSTPGASAIEDKTIDAGVGEGTTTAVPATPMFADKTASGKGKGGKKGSKGGKGGNSRGKSKGMGKSGGKGSSSSSSSADRDVRIAAVAAEEEEEDEDDTSDIKLQLEAARVLAASIEAQQLELAKELAKQWESEEESRRAAEALEFNSVLEMEQVFRREDEEEERQRQAIIARNTAEHLARLERLQEAQVTARSVKVDAGQGAAGAGDITKKAKKGASNISSSSSSGAVGLIPKAASRNSDGDDGGRNHGTSSNPESENEDEFFDVPDAPEKKAKKKIKKKKKKPTDALGVPKEAENEKASEPTEGGFLGNIAYGVSYLFGGLRASPS